MWVNYNDRLIAVAMLTTAQTLWRSAETLQTATHCAKAMMQNACVGTGKRPVHYIDGFLDQKKRKSK